VAAACGQAGLRWWAGCYAWKLVTEFPQRKDLLPEAYPWMLAYSFGSPTDPDAREWEPASSGCAARRPAGPVRA